MLFTHTLDSKGSYKLDKSNLYGSILALPEQIRATWLEVAAMQIPEDYLDIDEVVLLGMGGSALGARVANGLLDDELKVPLLIVNDFHLPKYVDERSLVILSSYSGTTEEVLSASQEVGRKRAKVMVIAKGGELKDWAFKKKVPIYGMESIFNPSAQPRMAIGHSVMGILLLLAKLGLAKISGAEIEESLSRMNTQMNKWGRENKIRENQAKRFAQKLFDKGVIMVSAAHLRGASYVFKNQLNENSKTFAAQFELPELDHHLLEGLYRPEGLKKKLIFVVYDSDLYEEKLRKRVNVVEDVIVKQGHEVIKLRPEGESKLSQVWEVILFGELVGFYLAILNKFDPAPIPWVDYLKKRMG